MRLYKPSRRRVQHICYMIEMGCGVPEVCDLLGVPRGTVERIAVKHGLTLSNSGAQTHRGLRKGNIFDAERIERPLPNMVIDDALYDYGRLAAQCRA